MIQDTTAVTYIGVIFFKGVGEIREYESDSVPCMYVCLYLQAVSLHDV